MRIQHFQFDYIFETDYENLNRNFMFGQETDVGAFKFAAGLRRKHEKLQIATQLRNPGGGIYSSEVGGIYRLENRKNWKLAEQGKLSRVFLTEPLLQQPTPTEFLRPIHELDRDGFFFRKKIIIQCMIRLMICEYDDDLTENLSTVRVSDNTEIRVPKTTFRQSPPVWNRNILNNLDLEKRVARGGETVHFLNFASEEKLSCNIALDSRGILQIDSDYRSCYIYKFHKNFKF